MKTVGERIRQAREAKGWSGEKLAHKVGYKTQSGISNLEARATGSGGNKIGAIAQALSVSLDWLMNGPDADNVPFLPPELPQHIDVEYATTTKESESGLYRLPEARQDRVTEDLLRLWSQLDAEGKAHALSLLQGFVAGRRPHADGNASAMAG